MDFQIKTPATIDSSFDVVSLEVSDKYVNVPSMYKLSVFSPVPLDVGCQVTITYPSDIKIGPEFNSISISGLFGSYR